MTPKTIGRRRNGKQQACEPCRRSKQSCSHTLPYCDRCVKTNKTEDCFYHAAPMTKGYDADNSTPLRQSSTTSSKRALSPNSGSPTPTSSHRAKSLKESDAPPPLPNHGRLFKTPHRWGTTSSFGSTSFSAIFRENQDKFGRDIFDTPHAGTATADASSPKQQKKLRQCLTILYKLPSEAICDQLLDSKAGTPDPLLPLPVIRAAVDSLWETFRHSLAELRTDKNLEVIIDQLNKNEAIQWTCIGDNTFGEWPNICCGRLLRWEMLGMIFVFLGLSYIHLKADDDIFKTMPEGANTRQGAAWQMKQCAEKCLAICQEAEILNEMGIALMREVMVLDGLFYGMDSKEVIYRQAILVRAVFKSGLHSMPKPPYVSPTSEYRRRIFMSIYDVDKALSWFAGMPPVMFQRHCMMQAPLDLSDEQLSRSLEEIASAAARLDQRGWNTDGKIHEVTTWRARYELSKVKEEIQDISAQIDPEGKKDRIDELLEKLDAVVATFPPQLQYKDPAPEVDGPPGVAIYPQSMLHLVFLDMRLHIERLRVQRKKRTSQGLFDTAVEILETIQYIFECRDQLTMHWFDWLLVAYGFPAAGVIILTATTNVRFNASRTPSSSVPSSVPSSQLPPSSQITTASTMSSATTASQPRNPAQLLAIKFDLPRALELLNQFFDFLTWSRSSDPNRPPASQPEIAMRKLTSALEQSQSQPSSQGPKSANNSFGGSFGASFGGGGPGMLYPKSANSSFGYPAAAEPGPSQSNLHSFQVDPSSFNASSIGSGSLGNTQLTTPTVGSFEGLSQPTYLADGGYMAEFDYLFDAMPECEQVLDNWDWSGGAPPEIEVPDVAQNTIIPWSDHINFSSSFGPNMGYSQ